MYDGIGRGKIKIPELHDIIPGAFRERKELRIKLQEIGYKSIRIDDWLPGLQGNKKLPLVDVNKILSIGFAAKFE